MNGTLNLKTTSNILPVLQRLWRQSARGQRMAASILALVAVAMPVSALAEPGAAGTASAAATSATRSVVKDGDVTFTVEIDRAAARVAEPVRLVLQAVAPRGTQLEMPVLGEQLGDLQVLSTDEAADIPVADNAGMRRWLLEATLETLETGSLRIPPVELHYRTDRVAASKTLRSEPLEIRILSVLEDRADPANFRDIKTVVDLEVPAARSFAWLWWTTAGIGAVAAVALLGVLILRRRSGSSPAEWAQAAIAQLEEQHDWQTAGAEAAYDGLIQILREYCELEFAFPAHAQSTSEFLNAAAEKARLSDAARQHVRTLAAMADEVKFARLHVTEEQVREAIQHARQFVAECENRIPKADKEAT